jgi:fibro-slime domain-containing protein
MRLLSASCLVVLSLGGAVVGCGGGDSADGEIDGSTGGASSQAGSAGKSAGGTGGASGTGGTGGTSGTSGTGGAAGKGAGGATGGAAGKGQSGNGQSGNGQSGGGTGGKGQSGNGQSGGGQAGQGQSGNGQAGQGQSGKAGQGGGAQGGNGQAGVGAGGGGQSGSGPGGQGQSGNGQSGSGPGGNGQAGDGQSGSGQAGDGQGGQGQSGNGQSGSGPGGSGAEGGSGGASGEGGGAAAGAGGQAGDQGTSGQGGAQGGSGQAGSGQAGSGQAGSGQAGSGCVATPEVCDGVDNNCDGSIDEGNPGGGVACVVAGAVGECAQGALQCQGGMLGCVASVQAGPEVCDGKDNNCDGQIDEGDPGGGGACKVPGLLGVCAVGAQICQGGAVTCEQTVAPSSEVCDGKDNNCDGQVDNAPTDVGGSCKTGLLGVCAKGTLQCAQGGVVCTPNQQPSAEVCDGLDNNCDGQVDEAVTQACGACNLGTQTCQNGKFGGCVLPPSPSELTLTATIRDFHQRNHVPNGHPDFEYAVAAESHLVKQLLGADGKPVYEPGPGSLFYPAGTSATTNGKKYFDQWYNDVKDINLRADIPLTLGLIAGSSPPTYQYDNSFYFPIDKQLFGNEENPSHNFGFTLETHTAFLYRGGEKFSFSGDDDLWVFINGQLAIDLGGVHGREDATVDLDAQAQALGISKCGGYTLDLFFAERHTTQSEFKIDTSLVLLAQ